MARLVSEKAAADYVGLPVSTFRAWVTAGKLPVAIPDCGLYDVRALDAAVDRLSGLGNPTNALDAWRAKEAKHARAS